MAINPNYIIYTLILIILMYLIAQISRAFLFYLKINFDFCPKCFSIFGSWMFLLFYKFILKNDFPIEIITLLIGGSVTGIAHALDKYIKKKEIKFAFLDFIFQFMLTLIALIFIYILSIG